MDDNATTTTALPARRAWPAPLVRVGLVGATAAAILAVGILAAGATASPSRTLAAGADTAITTLAGEVLPLGGPGQDDPDRGFGAGPGRGGITITGISGSNISLETADGWTRTIAVDSGTTFTRGGDTIALSDLSTGDQIRFRQTLEDDGTWSIDSVVVIPPHAGGTVTAISGSTITIEGRDGAPGTVRVTAATTYNVGGDASATLADVKVGMRLMAEGAKNSDGSLTATSVLATDPGAMPVPGWRGGFRGGFRGPGEPGGHGPWGGPWGDGAAPSSAPDANANSAG